MIIYFGLKCCHVISLQDVARHNLKCREYRQGIDQVDDMVQVALRTEIQETRRVREEMNQLLEIVTFFSNHMQQLHYSSVRLRGRLKKMSL